MFNTKVKNIEFELSEVFEGGEGTKRPAGWEGPHNIRNQ